MATILDDDDTIEAQSLSTSLDPYGQLMKMLMPRALSIAIYDRMATPLWLSDGAEGPDMPQLVEEALNSARSEDPDPAERDGFARSWDGDTAYVFILRESELLGAVAISCRDGSNGARPFSLMLGLLRPALQVLARELTNQFNVGEPQDNDVLRDSDLALLFEASGTADDSGSDDFEQLVRNCVTHLDCALGALFIPERKVAVSYSISPSNHRHDAELLDRTQRHLFAWAQVQRRTLTLNKAPPNSPLGALPYKILACPVRHGGQPVAGVLALFRPHSAADFDLRQVRILEMMARRIAYVLQNAYDSATGLLTRPAFEQRALATLTAGDTQGQHCVGYADVDRLHVVNENHGMHVGDQALERIAETIRNALPSQVIAARISGDRFALFFPGTTLQAAEKFLSGVCDSIEHLDYRHEGRRIELSMSFGLAVVPTGTRFPLSHAIATAEVACKAAKDRGRGRVELYQDEDQSIVKRYEDVTLVGDLREAIANDRFRMEAQPIIQLDARGPARRFELLLRMVDTNGESVAPDKFLSAAERYQLTSDIDRWVVQYALEILSSAAPALQGLGAHFAINLSGQSVGSEDFPAFLEAKLREYSLPPGLLSFEITETAAVANIVRAEMLIRQLRELGYGIALDDFGRGLSSLTYLKSLPVSDLKIDGGLVRDLAGGDIARAQAMVTAIVQLAQAMNLKTTAECVESNGILDAVSQLGVDYGQGFAIGRPRALELVLQELLRGAPGVTRVSGSPLMARLAG